MKKLLMISIVLLMISGTKAQSCLPEGITFYSQQQIDNFQIYYPNCTQLEGNVIIGDPNWSDITNLNGISVLTSIGGSLVIGGTYLVNLSGLENLTSIGGNLHISYNNSLASLSGLEGLT
jgi:hypothetical protein